MTTNTYAVLKNKQVVSCSIIKVWKFLWIKRYLVTYKMHHPKEHAVVSPFTNIEYPATEEYYTQESQWVKIVGKYND